MGEFAQRAHVPGIAYGIIVDGRVAHLGVSGVREGTERFEIRRR